METDQQQLCGYNLKTKGTYCGKYRHWGSNLNASDSTKDGLPSNDTSPLISSNSEKTNQNINNRPNNSYTSNCAEINFDSVSLSDFKDEQACATSRSGHKSLGPVVHGGAPYSGIGATKLCVFRSSLGLPQPRSFDPMPNDVSNHKWFQYGAVSHSIPKRRILRSVIIHCRYDLSQPIRIRLLVVADSSKWHIARNVTQNCNNLRIGDNRLQFLSHKKLNTFFLLFMTRLRATSRSINSLLFHLLPGSLKSLLLRWLVTMCLFLHLITLMITLLADSAKLIKL